ncbi:hypothetical protein P7245_22370 [Vibrio parahaemolyticus]|nr:hypothetical protein [Vibrio parahaemolyticus]
MSSFDPTNAQTAMTIDNIDYSDLYLNRVNSDNPQTVGLVLDHQGRSDGWQNGENTDQPVRVEVQLRGVEKELRDALKDAWKNRKKVDFVSVDPDNDITLTGNKMTINKDPRSRAYEAGTQSKFDMDLILLCAPKNWSES